MILSDSRPETVYRSLLDAAFRHQLCTSCKQTVVQHYGVCEACGKTLHEQQLREVKSRCCPSIPTHLRWASLENHSLLRQRIQDTDVVVTIANCFGALVTRSVPNVVLVGPSGSGKSSLSCAIMREVHDLPRWRGAHWQCAVKLGRARSDSVLGAVPPAIEEASSAPLLVLDDLGSEHQAGIEVLREVIHHRYHAGLPSVFTTWMQPEELPGRYGEGTTRRIIERAMVIRLGAQ